MISEKKRWDFITPYPVQIEEVRIIIKGVEIKERVEILVHID